MRGLKGPFLAVLLAAAPSGAQEPSVPEGMERLAGNLVAQHDARRPGRRGDSLAVFEFNAPEKLAKERAGFAASELLLQRFVRTRAFTVVERSALNRVLEEQRLQQTAAIDPQTAVRIGRLAGAHLLLLGSIDKLGKTYQVNARLVLVETGEVVAAGYEEFPAKAFEEEAKPYMALVPEHQAIGVYLAAGIGSAKASMRGATNLAGTLGGTAYSMTLTPTGASADFKPLGLGIRYSPRSWLMLDVAYMPVILDAGGDGRQGAAGTTNSSDGPSAMTTMEAKGSAVRVSANWVKRLGDRGFGYLGAGALGLEPAADEEKPTNPQHVWGSGGTAVTGEVPFAKTTGGGWAPFLRAGAEWRPQERFGVALFGQFLLGSLDLTQQVGVDISNSTTRIRTKAAMYDAELPKASLELTASLYF